MSESFDYAALTDIGLRRENNEDAYGFDAERGIFVVADGLGGREAGEVASAYTVAALVDALARTPFTSLLEAADVLETAIQEVNHAVWRQGQNDPALKGMATTLVAAVLCGSQLLIAWVGDSRAYVRRVHRLLQLTCDHTLMNDLIRAEFDRNLLKEFEQESPEQAGSITKAIGFEPSLRKVDMMVLDLRRGDQVVLCTDGLTGPVSEDDMLFTLLENGTEGACKRLVEQAYEGGAPDNITAIVVRFHGEQFPLPTKEDVDNLKAEPYIF